MNHAANATQRDHLLRRLVPAPRMSDAEAARRRANRRRLAELETARQLRALETAA